MRRRILSSLFLLLGIPLVLLPPAHGQRIQADINPLLEPVVARPTERIPDSLRGELGGRQGTRSLPGRGEALNLILRTTASREELEAQGMVVRTLRAGIATVTISPVDLPALVARGDVSQIGLPQILRPTLKKSIPDMGVTPLRSQSNGTFTGATGKGVIVGIVDSGIGLDHPNFKTPGGSTRLLYVWDQTHDPSGAGVKPAGFAYGTEWTAGDIDAGIATEQDEAAEMGHGTHVTGIAAGNGAAADEDGAFYASAGVAPESQIIFVKTTFATTDVIDGLEYIFKKADALGLPCVINLSLGLDVGSHTGTDPMEEAIDDLVTAKAGRAVVVAAGNSRADSIHAKTSTAQGAVTTQSFAIPSYTKLSGGEDFLYITGYYASTDTLSVELVSPLGKSFIKALANGTGCAALKVTDEGSVRICNGKKSSLLDKTTDREIFITLTDQNNNANAAPKAGTWKINLTGTTVTSTTGADFWMYSRLGATGTTNGVFSSGVDDHETVGIPGTSKEAITVGAYASRLCWTDHNGNPQTYNPIYNQKLNDIAFFSGIGPTRDVRFKPDLVAPGMGIVSALADEVRTGLLNAGYSPIVINDDYLLLQGTSQAAPHVTGAVALLFEKEPALTSAQVKTKLVNAARNDAYTAATAGIFGLNVVFGAGKLDLGSWAYSDFNETNDTITQATRALSGESFTGYIDRSSDVDLFDLLGVKTGDTLSVTLTNLPHDYALNLQGANTVVFTTCGVPGLSTVTTSDNPGTANETITFGTGGLSPSGVGLAHYMRVTSPTGVFDEAAGYQLKGIISRPEQAAAHGTTATAQPLPDFKEMKVTGNVSTIAQRDLYSLVISNFGTLTVTGPGGANTFLEILNSSGTVVASSTSGTVSYFATGQLFSSQTLYVQVRGQIFPYTLTLKK